MGRERRKEGVQSRGKEKKRGGGMRKERERDDVWRRWPWEFRTHDVFFVSLI